MEIETTLYTGIAYGRNCTEDPCDEGTLLVVVEHVWPDAFLDVTNDSSRFQRDSGLDCLIPETVALSTEPWKLFFN